MADDAEQAVEETPEADSPACANKSVRLVEPDLEFKKILEEFGGGTYSKCYQCATCSAVCSLSPDDDPFPRKEMAWALWGMKDRIIRDPDIWGCYYCGDCSERCPRGANPGEVMMALRRYATAYYDWTGLSRRLYTSRAWEIGAVVTVGLFVVLLFALSGAFSADRMMTDHVSVETFIPHHLVHYADLVMAIVLTFFLLTNSARMLWFLLDGQKIPLSLFIKELPTFIIHTATQRRWRDCAEPAIKWRWAKHFFMVTGYVTMFTLVMVFLSFLQADKTGFTWISIPGYYATIAILYFSVDSMIGRYTKQNEYHKFSHDSDWMFLILLFLTGVTGILMHSFRMLDLPLPTYFTYVIHLAVAVPMLVIEVPFMKWSHLMYRPLGLYVKALKDKAAENQAA